MINFYLYDADGVIQSAGSMPLEWINVPAGLTLGVGRCNPATDSVNPATGVLIPNGKLA